MTDDRPFDAPEVHLVLQVEFFDNIENQAIAFEDAHFGLEADTDVIPTHARGACGGRDFVLVRGAGMDLDGADCFVNFRRGQGRHDADDGTQHRSGQDDPLALADDQPGI